MLGEPYCRVLGFRVFDSSHPGLLKQDSTIGEGMMEARAGVPGGCVAWEGDPRLTLLLSFLLYIIFPRSRCGLRIWGIVTKVIFW